MESWDLKNTLVVGFNLQFQIIEIILWRSIEKKIMLLSLRSSQRRNSHERLTRAEMFFNKSERSASHVMKIKLLRCLDFLLSEDK